MPQFPLKPALVLIDLDGTLIDSVPDLTFCVDAMMACLKRPPAGEALVRTWVGNGVETLVARALTGTLHGTPDPAEYAEAYPIFLEFYAAHSCQRSRLYPGVREGLEWLKARGYRLGCVTNKAARFTEPLLAHFRLCDYFELVISGDTVAEKKPSPLPLLHAAQFFNVEPTQSLMIGDSISDVKAARAAGFAIICMSDGYNHGNDIRLSEPDAVIYDMTELERLLV